MAAPPPIRIPGVRFEHLIGTGGMSEVWLGYHGGLGREVAIKVMLKSAAESGEDVRQFVQEGRVMERLNHPGIVHAYESDCRDGRYYSIMDYVEGYTFALLLAKKERIPEEDALVVLDSVADALGYAWNELGVVHCDIKPDNIMAGTDGIVRIMDLGLCKMPGNPATGRKYEPDGTVKDTVTGTPAYMSPEQIRGEDDIDLRSDIYSMGATLYHLTTGRILFPMLSNDESMTAHTGSDSFAPDPRTIVPSLSGGFARLLSLMCVKDRNMRPRDWKEVAAMSELVAKGMMPHPLPPGAASSVKEGV